MFPADCGRAADVLLFCLFVCILQAPEGFLYFVSQADSVELFICSDICRFGDHYRCGVLSYYQLLCDKIAPFPLVCICEHAFFLWSLGISISFYSRILNLHELHEVLKRVERNL